MELTSPPIEAGVGETPREGERFGPLYLGSLIAYGDRFLIGPILVIVAADFEVTLGAAAAVATSYLFVYGVLQPVYGLLSDRWGRVRVMRWALSGVVAANVCSALAPDVATLVASRAIGAGFVAALLPTALVYVGDRVPFARRQQTIANVLAAGAVGTVGATVGAGVLGRYTSWRFVFLVPAALALVDAVVLRRLPESLPAEAGAGPIAQIRRVLVHRWALFLVLLAVAEGGVMLGFLTFLAPALQVHGVSSAAAGLVVAAYGVAVFGGLQLVKGLLRRAQVPPPIMIAIGGTVLVAAFLVAASDQEIVNILAASLLIGVGYSFMHSTLQTWATEVTPEARGTATSLFVTAVFTGASIVHTQISPLASDHRFGALFTLGAAVAVPVTVVASLSRARFAHRS
ncbi:MAG TPA: MFS transporter [Acidimicrobiales bacterium]|nr:MFS transporter [Acidimicrobiales bacterium]